MEADPHFDALQRSLAIVRDRVRGVVYGEATGFYLHGRPGTSKTHTVVSTLKRLNANYTLANGHLTPIGLFDLLDENRDRIVVLDDIASLFAQPLAVQFLLAALAHPTDRSRIRRIRRKTAVGDQVIPYTGDVIALSNLPLSGHHREIFDALNDRIFVTEYDPPDEQIHALIKHLARQGIKGVAPRDATMVAAYLIEECRARGVRPSLRTFVDKALADFRLYRSGQTETNWRDLVVNSIEQQTLELQHPVRDIRLKDEIEAERKIVLQIVANVTNRQARIAAWQAQTGKSQSAFYRRMAELQRAGRISKSTSAAGKAKSR